MDSRRCQTATAPPAEPGDTHNGLAGTFFSLQGLCPDYVCYMTSPHSDSDSC
jgi:hypothetical protein